jgi:hypothetical protein
MKWQRRLTLIINLKGRNSIMTMVTRCMEEKIPIKIMVTQTMNMEWRTIVMIQMNSMRRYKSPLHYLLQRKLQNHQSLWIQAPPNSWSSWDKTQINHLQLSNNSNNL